MSWLNKYKEGGYPQVGPRDWMNEHGWLAQYGGYSTQGYKKNSPDKHNPFNIIPSGEITMKNVEHPVYAVDNQGNQQIMSPGSNYRFPGDKVLEIPLKQKGRWLKKY